MPAENAQPASGGDGWRPRAWACLAACLTLLALLVALALDGDLARPGVPWRFFVLLSAAGLAYLAAVPLFGSVPARFRPRLFWSVTIATKLAVLWMAPGDDIWRYMWEGHIQHSGLNPYLLAPDSPRLESLRTAWWEHVNHRHWAAIYPPGAELAFRLMTQWGAAVAIFKCSFLALDLGTVYMLLRMHVGPARHRDTAWYAWCPLVAAMFAGAAHFDSMLVFLLTAALWALHRADPMNRQRPSWPWLLLSGLALGAAISVKVIPALLLPLLVFHLRGRFVALLPGLAIPPLLALAYGFPQVDILANLRDFANVTRTNDFLWWAVEPLWPNPGEKNLGYNLAIAGWTALAGWVFRHHWRRGALWVLGGALVLSPVVHAWYLTWVLPLAAWRRAHAWFILSVSMSVYFLLYQKTIYEEQWTMEPGWRLWLLAPPLLWLALRGVRLLRARRLGRRP